MLARRLREYNYIRLLLPVLTHDALEQSLAGDNRVPRVHWAIWTRHGRVLPTLLSSLAIYRLRTRDFASGTV